MPERRCDLDGHHSWMNGELLEHITNGLKDNPNVIRAQVGVESHPGCADTFHMVDE